MNIQMQTGGLCLILLVFYCCKRRKTLGFYSGKLFMLILYLTFGCVVLDILSIILIVNKNLFPLWLVNLECKAYLISLGSICGMMLMYANADIRHLAKADRFTICISAVVIAASIFVVLSPISLYQEDNVTYTYGMACNVTYVGAFLLIMATCFELIIHGKTMNPKRRNTLAFWLIIWVVSCLIQFFNKEFLLVGFAASLGITMLFFELENPELYIDSNTGFYNSYAFGEFIRQKYRLGEDIYGIVISLEDIHEKDFQITQIELAMVKVTQFLKQISDAAVFKTDGREFALLFESPAELKEARLVIEKRFENQWLTGNDSISDDSSVFLQPNYLVIPSGVIAKNAEEMLGLLRYFRLHCDDTLDDNTMILDENMIAGKKSRDEMLEATVSAIKEDRIEVFFQPIYSVAEKKFVSAEALVRIIDNDGTIIPPYRFIPIAEETGLISQIGELVFEKTCRFIKEQKLEKYGIRFIDINLSVIQCENETLADTFISIMEKHQLPPEYICLEITESSAAMKKNIMLENMNRLIDYGVIFALDDFGNGQSNLNYIVDMPVKIVKFDFDMTQAYFKTEKGKFVLQAAAKMIHDMCLKIVSEGVETAEQFDTFSDLGIDYIQGYYFSKPLDADAFIEFLKDKNI